MLTISRRYYWLALLGGMVLSLLCGSGVEFIASAGPPFRPTPTPLPPSDGGQVILQGVGGKFPDLVVESITVIPERPLTKQQAIIQVTIRNQGKEVKDDNNFFVDLYIDPDAPPEGGCPSSPGTPGDYWWGVQGAWMTAGASYVLTTTWVFTDTRTYDLYAQVDTECNVIEADEYNNVAGPVGVQVVWVRTAECFRQDSHPDFQYGFSNLDISQPDGMLYLGAAYSVGEPSDSAGGTPALDHRPEVMVNDVTYTLPFTTTPTTDTTKQEAPVMVNGPGDDLYVIWEDSRNGELYNQDIYFAYSLDGGDTWSQDIRVNQDALTVPANQGAPDLAFDAASSTLYAIWHDNRAGNYDIYVARSTDGGRTWHEVEGNPVNDDLRGADQLNPALAVDEEGILYAVWQDERNGNSDIYFALSCDGGESWSRNVFVSNDPESPEATEQWQTSPSLAVYGGKVYVAWEDERSLFVGDPADIYFTWGKPCHDPCDPDAGCDSVSFDVPIRVNDDDLGAEQRQPVIAAHGMTVYVTRMETIDDPEDPEQTIDVVCTDVYPGAALHFAWQDFRAGPEDPDIYYAWTFADFEYRETLPCEPVGEIVPPDPEELVDNPFGLDYEILGNKQVNSWQPSPQAADDSCAHPQDEAWGDYEGSSWQGDPAMLVSGDGVFIAWADGWVFDDYWNYDIWVANTYRISGESGEYLIGESVVVNDNAKLYSYLNAEKYPEYGPASARQGHPSLASCTGLPCVVWDDNRRADPLAGCVSNHDIFFARPRASSLTEGVYLSPVFDAGLEDATWYIIDWWGVTPHGTKLIFQTRMGNTPWPDEHWTQWTGAVEQDGERVYDAPGQHIVDEAGNPFPRYRYIQYKARLVSCAGSGASPYLYSVTLYHNHPVYRTFLPLIWRGFSAPWKH